MRAMLSRTEWAGEVQNPCLLPLNLRCSESYGNSGRDFVRDNIEPDSERQGRVIDFDQAASMEKNKQEGHF